MDGQTIILTSGTLSIDKNITFDNCSHTLGITIAGSGINVSINTGKSLTLSGCSKITVGGAITNNAGVSGLVLASGASFIYNYCDLPATVKRDLNNKWHLFGSPFKQGIGNTLANITPSPSGTTQLKPYTNGVNWVSNVTSPLYLFQPTVGYAVSPGVALTPASLSGNLFCTGLPFPCEYSIPLVYNGTLSTQSWNLIANPFPSYLDWRALGKTNLSTTLYVWDNTLAIGPPLTNTSYFRTYNAVNG